MYDINVCKNVLSDIMHIFFMMEIEQRPLRDMSCCWYFLIHFIVEIGESAQSTGAIILIFKFIFIPLTYRAIN